MLDKVKRLCRGRRSLVVLEYALISALVLVVIVSTVQLLATSMDPDSGALGLAAVSARS